MSINFLQFLLKYKKVDNSEIQKAILASFKNNRLDANYIMLNEYPLIFTNLCTKMPGLRKLSNQNYTKAKDKIQNKIFSVEQFHIWLARPESQEQIRRCLTALRDAGMAMEISSAGLRKACREIYPAPPIMALAAGLGLSVSFASDAHGTDDVAYGFARLASYARAFGFREYVFFDKGRRTSLPL